MSNMGRVIAVGVILVVLALIGLLIPITVNGFTLSPELTMFVVGLLIGALLGLLGREVRK
jgi:MFS-type transporter involved in bile tolerance (Atg22 family)